MTTSAQAPKTAIVLAAGMGIRLRDVAAARDLPKGLLVFDGEPIIARSLRLLREQGVQRIVIVVGYQKEAYARFATSLKFVELVENRDFATSGTMASLACALDHIAEDFFLLESDIVFERRAFAAIVESRLPDVVLASGPTCAGDEVWVEAPAGTLVAMSKDRTVLGSVCGELVGVHRISASLAASLREAYAEFIANEGHHRMSYETDALVRAARNRSIAVRVVPDLLWGEIDDSHHYRRVRDEVLPLILRREKIALATMDEPS